MWANIMALNERVVSFKAPNVLNVRAKVVRRASTSGIALGYHEICDGTRYRHGTAIYYSCVTVPGTVTLFELFKRGVVRVVVPDFNRFTALCKGHIISGIVQRFTTDLDGGIAVALLSGTMLVCILFQMCGYALCIWGIG